MYFRNLLFAAVAGLLIGVGAGPVPAEAHVVLPIEIDFNYCWGSTSPCPHVYVDFFHLLPDHTWYSDSGYTGTWTYNKATRTVTIMFDNPGTVYYGIHQGGGVIEGTMEAPQYTNYGTWSGQVDVGHSH